MSTEKKHYRGAIGISMIAAPWVVLAGAFFYSVGWMFSFIFLSMVAWVYFACWLMLTSDD